MIFSIDSQKSILALTGILALAFQYINIFQVEWINKILPICIALLTPIFVYSYLNIEQEDEVIAKNADETYRLDNCIGNLEFDLEKIHKDIYQINNKKIIYVIDELDKLGLESNNSKIVDEILNYLKNFFTLSNAIFIFIGDEKLYDSYDLNSEKKAQANNNNDDRKRNYTYFTSKYFISRPLWLDLDFYFLEIFKETDMTDSELSILKRALCFEARNDFFDIKKFINDRITSFNLDNEPIIELEDSYEDVLKSRFHKVITLLFDEKYRSKYPTKWRENERLIKKLFEHAYSIFERDVGETFEDLKDDSIDSQMTRDFNGFLESLGALRMEKETTIQLRGINVPIRTYWYSGDIPTEPPMHLSEATEFEKRYIYKFELFLKFSKAIIWAFETAKGLEEHQVLPHMEESNLLINRLKELGYNIQSFYEVNLKIYNNIINKKEIYPYRREDIEKKTKDLENQIDYMLLNLPQFISKMVIVSESDIQLKTIEKKNDVFNIIPEEYRDKFFGGNVIEESESLKQILLVNGKEVFLRKIDNILGENSKTHMIVCIKKIKGEEPGKFYRVISAASPRDLRESLISFLLDAKGFLKPEKLQDATINDTK